MIYTTNFIRTMEYKKLLTITGMILGSIIFIILISARVHKAHQPEPTPFTHEEYCRVAEYKPLGCNL